MIDRDRLVAFMRDDAYHPMSLAELAGGLGVPASERAPFAALLDRMVEDGTVVRTRADRFGLPDRMNLVVGKVVVHPDGYGFLVPDHAQDDDGGSDLFLAPRTVKEAPGWGRGGPPPAPGAAARRG
jgi:ribonuclease R